MGSLQERAVTLISQPPSLRTARDIEMVLPWLQKRSQLLMELDRDTLKDILRHCSYEKATTDDVIIKQGQIGDKFYVIMTGRASVYIVTRTEEEEGAGEEASSTPSKAKAAKQIEEEEEASKASTEAAQQEDHGPEGLDRTVFGKFIMYYEAGTSFGEIALMSAESTRNATIIADGEMDLLVIDRALFNRSVKRWNKTITIISDWISKSLHNYNRKIPITRCIDPSTLWGQMIRVPQSSAKEEAAYRERVDFVEHSSLFRSWTVKLRRLLEMSLMKEVHPYGSVIMRQGQPAHGLVFILSGQARVCMEPSRHETQYPALLKPPPDPLITANKKPPVRDKARAPRARKTHAQIEVRRQEGYAAAEQRMRRRSVDLCCLQQNEVIGDTEMVLELDTNLATVVSTATTEVFVLNAKNYERLVTRKHPHTVRLLLQHVCQKLAARLHSAKAAQLPIVSRLHATATAQQRRVQGADRVPKVRAKGGSQERTGVGEEKTLVRMFLQGRVPLIKPCVPDALYYREASASKMKAFMKSPYAKLRTLGNLSTYAAMRRKAPRSILQLKGNVKAERELLGYQEDNFQVEEDEDEDYRDVSLVGHNSLPQRPASAAPGVRSPRIMARAFASARPHSAMDMRIVPCQDEEDGTALGGASYGWGTARSTGWGEKEKHDDTLDQNTVSEIFCQMDAMQRDKIESRIRAMYTNTARSELRSKLEREPSWSEGHNAQGYEELFEDSFYDWETSDGNLRDLEARIASFCTPRDTEQPVSSRSRPTVSTMKRFEVEDPNNIPLAGGTVFVHQKPCRYTPSPSPRPHHPHSIMAGNAPHLHVRRFMLQRDKQSQFLFGS